MSGHFRALALVGMVLVGLSMMGAARAVAQGTYSYNSQKYSSAKDALAAYQHDLDTWIAAVPAAPAPVPGKVLIVLPDRDRLRPLVLSGVKGAPAAEGVAYVVEGRRQFLWAVANAIIKAHVFEQAQIAESNDTLQPAFPGFDYIVWYQVKSVKPDFAGPWTGAWLMRKSGNSLELRPVVDPGLPPQRVLTVLVATVRQGLARFNAPNGAASPAAAGTGAAPAGAHPANVGSGIIISAEGAVLTNEHVVQGCREVRVRDQEGAISPASLRASDVQNDLALLKAEHRFSAAAQFRDGAGVRPGDGVVALGYPLGDLLGSQATLTTGTVSALTGMRNDSRLLQVSAPVQQGNSGGPLLDMSGHVVGVVSAKLNALALAALTGDIAQNVNFAIKAAVARDFLDANGVKYATATSQRPLAAADVGDIARKFTAFVECWK